MKLPILRSARTHRVAGAVLVGVGGLLLAASVAYYAYGAVARSTLGELSYSVDRPSVMPEKAGSVARDHQGTAASEDTSSQIGLGAGVFSPRQDGPEEGPRAVDARSDGGVASVKSPDVQSVDASVVGGLGQPDDGVSPAAVVGYEAQLVGASDVPVTPDDTAVKERGEPLAPTDADSELTMAIPPLPASAEANGVDTPGPTQALDSGGADGGAGRAAGDELAMAGEAVSGETSGPAQVLDRGHATEEMRQPDGSTAANAIGDDSPDTESPVSPSIAAAFALALEAVQAEADVTTQAIDASKAEVASYSQPTAVDLEGSLAAATRIRIPAIRLDSDVKELEVVSSGGGYAWETPKWLVGHIPTTAVAGGQGEGWYFGHLQSPIKREGNVFLKLPEIPGLLNGGEPVYIFLEAAGRKFVYQAYKVDTVHEDDLKITDSGNQDITLVTCVPEYYYDYRLMVTAALVGVSES